MRVAGFFLYCCPYCRRKFAMPVAYLRSLAGKHRTVQANRHLAFVLSAVAGAINAGGFLVVGQFTSHMSGILSTMAEDFAAGAIGLLLAGAASLFCFIAGAASSAVMINWARKRQLEAEYASPLLVEAVLLLFFALLGGNVAGFEWLFVPVTVMLLCFIMGLQNAMITKLSHGEIRTTHVTGMITDIGIELGKALYWNSGRYPAMQVRANVLKLKNRHARVGWFQVRRFCLYAVAGGGADLADAGAIAGRSAALVATTATTVTLHGCCRR